MGINIGKRDFTLPISKIWYNKIKNQGEKMLQVLFNPTEKRSNHKAVLIIEFNTKNFEDFFIEGKNYEENILFYGRRRPAIWDLHSFNIIKKSGCKIITPVSHDKLSWFLSDMGLEEFSVDESDPALGNKFVRIYEKLNEMNWEQIHSKCMKIVDENYANNLEIIKSKLST